MIEDTVVSTLAPHDQEELRYAKSLLERPGLAARLTSLLGSPIERGLELLPDRWAITVNDAVELSLRKAMDMALVTMREMPGLRSMDRLHKLAVVGTGGVGGAFGLAALPVELPISTAIMLRSIADIARSEGENLSNPEGKLACLEVFALGGRTETDDAVETGYFAIRAALASTLADAARHLAQRGLAQEGAPALARFIAKIASRFGASVAEKAAAMAVPAIGAVGGGAINALFIDHFQRMARGHFKVRKLERKYGAEPVRRAYLQL